MGSGARGRVDRPDRRAPRWVVRALGTAVAAVLAAGLTPGVATAVPGDDEIAAAEAARDAAAAQVGALGARLAEAEAASAAAHQAAQIALQEYEERRSAQQAAQAVADAALAAAGQAAADLARGRAEVVSFARNSYMQGSTSPGTAALIDADGPAQFLERAALLASVGTHRVDVMTMLAVLEEQARSASATAQEAAAEAGALEAAAAEALVTARGQEVAARAQAAALAEQRRQWEAELAAAQATVYGLEGAQAAAAAAAAAAEAARARPPAPRPAGPSGDVAIAPPAGPPASSAVRLAIAAAKSMRGLPYSWGGGDSSGPTAGIDPDEDIVGFDCSGLTEYAYAQAGIRIGGTSREQYARFRHAPVAAADLEPGDLVFWATGTDYMSIYHVALYIGDDEVIQAPQSGDVVRISAMWFGADYYGAVRPTA